MFAPTGTLIVVKLNVMRPTEPCWATRTPPPTVLPLIVYVPAVVSKVTAPVALSGPSAPVEGNGSHQPLVHVAPVPHAVPHAPQFFGSLLVLVHVPPHDTWPVGQPASLPLLLPPESLPLLLPPESAPLLLPPASVPLLLPESVPLLLPPESPPLLLLPPASPPLLLPESAPLLLPPESAPLLLPPVSAPESLPPLLLPEPHACARHPSIWFSSFAGLAPASASHCAAQAAPPPHER